jgi:CheY-like chemotaxis protein
MRLLEHGEKVKAEVIALVDDLFFQSKILETARRMGVEVKIVATGEQLVAEAANDSPALLLVDLNARQGPLEAIEQLRRTGNQRPVIAFLSHVQVELAERARAAGCQQVMPRSQFSQNLAAILAQAKSEKSQ